MKLVTKIGAAFAVGCGALLAAAEGQSDATTADIKPWTWDKRQLEDAGARGDWNAGFLAGLDCLILLDLELEMKGERKTWGEMAEICRSRNNVAGR